MTLTEFDKFSTKRKGQILFRCCGSHEWVKSMINTLPVADLNDLLEYAEEFWYDCNHADWLEAFENQARVEITSGSGQDDLPQLTMREQKSLLASDSSIMAELSEANEEYEEIFGYMFITYAPGKTAGELLKELRARVYNDPRDEILIAAGEQARITRGRLKKLFSGV